MTVVLAGLIPGGWEWLLVILAIILLFGATKIPQVARALGRSKGEFKRGMTEGERAAAAEAEEERKREEAEAREQAKKAA